VLASILALDHELDSAAKFPTGLGAVVLTDHGFSCEARVELAASTAAGPRPSLLFTTAGAGPRSATFPAAVAGLVSCNPKLGILRPGTMLLRCAELVVFSRDHWKILQGPRNPAEANTLADQVR